MISSIPTTAGPKTSSAIALPGLMLTLLMFSAGCTSFQAPSLSQLTQNPLSPPTDQTHYVGPEGASALPSSPQSEMEMVYHGTRQARANQGIVLHIQGGDPAVRVLPLPADGRSVYVSQLLTQSGILEKLGNVEATLFRHSEQSISGLPMECKMTRDGKQIKPESDYSLRPGDRLRVRKSTKMGMDSLVDLVLMR